jgi:phosphate transport system protein
MFDLNLKKMARESFHNELNALEEELVNMGKMASAAIRSSFDALVSRDIKTSKVIIKNDLLINKKRFEIEEKCISLIATQQPMAGDLRIIAAIFNIITDLERIADHAEGIARICEMIGKDSVVNYSTQMPEMDQMVNIGIKMINNVLKAFINRDSDLARALCDEDDKVDQLYEQVYKKLLHMMIEHPPSIEKMTYLIWVAHNLERIGDRATNIAERVVFMVTGKMEEINVSRY